MLRHLKTLIMFRHEGHFRWFSATMLCTAFTYLARANALSFALIALHAAVSALALHNHVHEKRWPEFSVDCIWFNALMSAFHAYLAFTM